MTNTIETKTDIGRLLSNIKATFSGTGTYIREALQNARRAGATRVEITAEAISDTECRIIFKDDGKGVDDFSALLSLAATGWDEATVAEESPFGMGFFSLIFAANQFVVSSGSQCVKGTQGEMFNQESLTLDPCLYTLGTNVELICDIDMLDMFNDDDQNRPSRAFYKLVRGFGLPISVNGLLIERPYAENVLGDDAILCEGDFGKAYRASTGYSSRSFFFIQGFEVDCSRQGGVPDGAVVHARNGVFEVRMPDRDALIKNAVNTDNLQRMRNATYSAVMKDHAAAGRWEKLWNNIWGLESSGLISLLNDCDYVPKNLLLPASGWEFVNGTAYNIDEWDADISHETTLKDELGDARVISRDTAWNGLASRPVLAAYGFYILAVELDSNHWACKNKLNMPFGARNNEFSIEVVGKGDVTKSVNSPHIGNGKVRLCDSVKVTSSFGEVSVDQWPMLHKGEILVPTKVEVVEPTSIAFYGLGDGSVLDEAAYDRDEAKLKQALLSLRKTPLDCLKDELSTLVASFSEGLMAGNYRLTIAPSGEVEVTSAA